MNAITPQAAAEQACRGEAGDGVPAELPAAACEGYIDFISAQRTFGWAWCSKHPNTAVEVEIRIDGRPVVVARADRFRPDLARVGVGDGHHGFDVSLPEPVKPEEKHRVSAYVVVAPGQPEVPLVNRTLAATTPHPAAGTLAAGGDASRSLTCATQVRDVLSRVTASQKSIESSLTALAEEIRQLSATRTSVDGRTEAALTRAIDQLHAVQDMLGRQSAATEVLQTRLDGIAATLRPSEQPESRHNGGDRPLYWSVGVLAAISVSALAFGILSLLG